MARSWLLKTEPSEYSYDDLERDGRTVWDGVANNLALKHIREMRPGDEAFIYHTGRERAIVGLARIESDPYPNPEAEDERIVVFRLSPVRRLARPITLDELKARDEFEDWELVRIPRLSVMPVPETLRARIIKLSDGA